MKIPFLGGNKREPIRDNPPPPPIRRGRPPGARDKAPRRRRTALERAIDEYVASLREHNPEELAKLARAKLGLTDENEKKDDLSRMIETVQQLRQAAGLILPDGHRDNGFLNSQMGVALVGAAAPIFDKLATKIVESNIVVTGGPRGALTTPGAAAATPDAPPSLGRQFITALEGRTPREAADVLLGQPDHGVLVMCEELAKLPNELALEYMERKIVPQFPEMREFTDWLRGRQPWFGEVIGHIRARLANANTNGLAAGL